MSLAAPGNRGGKAVGRTRRTPQRTCVGCGEVQGKRGLIRFVRTAEGVAVDPTGRRNGRGAYVHRDAGCLERALAGRLGRSLRVSLSPEQVGALRLAVEALLAAPAPRPPMVHRSPVPLPPELIARGRRGVPRLPARRGRREGSASESDQQA